MINEKFCVYIKNFYSINLMKKCTLRITRAQFSSLCKMIKEIDSLKKTLSLAHFTPTIINYIGFQYVTNISHKFD